MFRSLATPRTVDSLISFASNFVTDAEVRVKIYEYRLFFPPPPPRKARRLTKSTSISLCVPILVFTYLRVSGIVPHHEPSLSSPLLILNRATINLGTLDPGQGSGATVVLSNPCGTSIAIDHIETSCPCIQATVDRLPIGPGKSVILSVSFDPSEEAGFRGRLAVELVGKSSDGVVVLRGRVDLEVKDLTITAGHALPISSL